MPQRKPILFEGLNKIKIKSIDKLILGEIREEKKRVPQSIKTKVYERAKGRCEYPRCTKRLKKSEGQFHHWRDPPTERTTAFLCYKHHKEHGHTIKTQTDVFGNKKVRIVRHRIPIAKKKKPRTRRTKKKR